MIRQNHISIREKKNAETRQMIQLITNKLIKFIQPQSYDNYKLNK